MKTPILNTRQKAAVAIGAATTIVAILVTLVAKGTQPPASVTTVPAKGSVTLTAGPLPASPTPSLPAATDTPAAPTTTELSVSATLAPTVTLPPTLAASPTPIVPVTPGLVTVAYPDAPLCPDHGPEHDNSLFHTLWDETRGCHYDHEHGVSPFTPEVAQAFPGLNLQALLGGVQIGHTNPSSPAENVAKHQGFKWQVSTSAPHGCQVGFESGTVAVDAYAIQFHSFGPQSIELEARNHSSAALLRQCKPDNPSDKGYIYTVQLQEYGERCLPYQGITLPYPDNPSPAYDCAFGQYNTTEGFGTHPDPSQGACRPSLAYYDGSLARNNLSVWTSKTTGSGARPVGSTLFQLLFRSRDVYQSLDCSDMVHPFTWRWLCSLDAGLTYAAFPGCRYNNSTVTVHEIQGNVPTQWDQLPGFDSDPRPTRVSGQAFTTRFGALALTCASPMMDCAPVVLINAFTGKYSSELSAAKVSNPTPADTPERDIYFCGNSVCAETAPGARASGWIGPAN